MTSFDIIIVGAGASGLLLADALGNDPHFQNRSILLLEKDPEKNNDRTWCYWETGRGEFDGFLYASWKHVLIKGKREIRRLPIAPYRYKMIRSSDFYNVFQNRLLALKGVAIRNEQVLSVAEDDAAAIVTTSSNTYRAGWVFSSSFSWEILKQQQEYPVLQQHFKGWFVRTGKPVFDAGAATFMDFSVAQLGNTRFMYVLPFSEHEALVEYTLFSAELLPEEVYEEAIGAYLRGTLNCDDFEILEKEKGRIPMTCFDFTTLNSPRILHIGAAGGWAKPSTGFTFMNTRKKTEELVEYLKQGNMPGNFGRKTRFWWYDLLLLDILNSRNELGSAICGALFEKRDAPLILKFLDEETSVWEDLKVIWACPKIPFIKALFRRLF
jgi:lycopene beta-cyclase